MEADPGQTRDIAATEPTVAARLRAIAADWRRDGFEPARRQPAGPGTLVLRATAVPGKQVADVRRLVLVPVRN